MACVHNQAKINELNAQITIKETQISDLNSNISKCCDIREKHNNFNKSIDCVINNLEGNTVVAGVPYDQGMMSECLQSSNDTIKDCDNIIKTSQEKIELLRVEIESLRSSIASLQGNCSLCVIDAEDGIGRSYY